jgi:hypothetical protein
VVVFKDGREGVEDEQHAGRPSTSRTENNVARVKAVLDRDRCLSRVGRTTENVHPRNHYERSAHEKNCRHVDPSPRQCAKSYINHCEGIFGPKLNHNASPPTVQP